MTALAARWNGYWFAPAPLFNLAVFRIILTASHLWWIYEVLYRKVLRHANLDPAQYDPQLLLQILTAPVDPATALSVGFWQTVLWITIATAILGCIGLATNASLIICAVTTNMLHLFINSFGEMHHNHTAMSIALVLLALAPCGRVLSLDWRLRRPPDRPPLDAVSDLAGWPVKALFWMFALFYLSAVYLKLDDTWLNGFTLQYYLAMDGLRWDRPFTVWLAQFHDVVLLMQVGVIAFQSTFWLCIIFPRLRWIYIPAGLLIHVSFWILLTAPFPQWIACYAAFIPWSAIFLNRGVKRGTVEASA